jgi:hypothetical protein
MVGGESHCGLETFDLDADKISARRLMDVQSAVKAVLFTALIFSVGESNARGRDYDPPLWRALNSHTSLDRGLGDNPTRDDAGGWCTDRGATSGPIQWVVGPAVSAAEEVAAPDPAAGGSGSPPPPPAIPVMLIPDLDKVACVGIAYGNEAPKWGFAVNNIWAFADGDTEVYSLTLSVPPGGFVTDTGVTAIGPYWPLGGTTILFADALSPHPGKFIYYDDVSKKNLDAPGPFSALEWAILTYAHEITHQNGMGTTPEDELKAEGYAYNVLKDYRDDGGKKCL